METVKHAFLFLTTLALIVGCAAQRPSASQEPHGPIKSTSLTDEEKLTIKQEAKLDGTIEVAISIRQELQRDGRVFIFGETNLPEGTTLIISIQDVARSSPSIQTESYVRPDGRFAAVPLGPKDGLANGVYVADVTMPFVRQQPAHVRKVTGENGENLTGPLIVRTPQGVSAELSAEFTVERNPEQVAEAKREAEELDKARERMEAQSVQVNVGYMSYKVWRTWWSDRLSSNEFLDSRPNAKWLFVELSARNNDKKPRMIPPFKLMDEQEREYDSSSEGALIESAIGPLESLNPDVVKQGRVVFDVPQNRTYRLKVSGGFWSREDTYIPLSPSPR
jgi:hypothetical protein